MLKPRYILNVVDPDRSVVTLSMTRGTKIKYTLVWGAFYSLITAASFYQAKQLEKILNFDEETLES